MYSEFQISDQHDTPYTLQRRVSHTDHSL